MATDTPGMIVEDIYRQSYHLHTPWDKPVTLPIAARRFFSPELTRQYVEQLRAPIDTWRCLLARLDGPAVASLDEHAIRIRISQWLIDGRIKLYPLTHQAIEQEGMVRIISSQESNTSYTLVPASYLLLHDAPELKTFHTVNDAENWLKHAGLDATQRNMLLACLPDTTEDESKKPEQRLANSLLSGHIVVIGEKRISAPPVTSSAALPAANNSSSVGLGPHGEGGSSPDKHKGPDPDPRKQAESDIESGAAHDFSQDGDGKMRQMYDDYNADPPRAGATAKQLGPKLSTMKEDEFLGYMEAETASGKCVMTPEHGLRSPLGGSQTMLKYEYPDGTMVRYKPDGDAFRAGQPTYSIEIKKNPNLPDRGGPNAVNTDVAFKVDEKGRLVPRTPRYMNNPYPANTEKSETYSKTMMDAGHKTLPVN